MLEIRQKLLKNSIIKENLNDNNSRCYKLLSGTIDVCANWFFIEAESIEFPLHIESRDDPGRHKSESKQ